MGACMLLRREAVEEVGYCDEDYFLFSEETDWCYRFREAGWEVVFFPGAECVHVRGASHSGRLYRENLRGHLLFLWKHRGPKDGRARAPASARARCGCAGSSSAASAGAPIATAPAGSRPETPPRCSDADHGRSSTSSSRSRRRSCSRRAGSLARTLGVRSVSASLAWALVVVFAALGGHVRARRDADD